MKNLVVVVIALATCINCTGTYDIEKLNGYWEIDEVELKNGIKKDYSVNTSVDYIELTSDSTGIRTKLYPLADGTYRTTNDSESFQIKTSQEGLIIKYSTDMDSWSEHIEVLDDNRLVIKNDSSIRYIYKRFITFDLQ